jgi:hypothetical protein
MYAEEPNDLDFMISTGENKSAQFLIEQIKHYVGQLNTP